jgi:hypothetical protein
MESNDQWGREQLLSLSTIEHLGIIAVDVGAFRINFALSADDDGLSVILAVPDSL